MSLRPFWGTQGGQSHPVHIKTLSEESHQNEIGTWHKVMTTKCVYMSKEPDILLTILSPCFLLHLLVAKVTFEVSFLRDPHPHC